MPVQKFCICDATAQLVFSLRVFLVFCAHSLGGRFEFLCRHLSQIATAALIPPCRVQNQIGRFSASYGNQII